MKLISIFLVYLVFVLLPYVSATRNVSNECVPLFNETAFHTATSNFKSINRQYEEHFLSAMSTLVDSLLNRNYLIFAILLISVFLYRARQINRKQSLST